jgi:dTDP-4-dehydrorhamnose reductase
MIKILVTGSKGQLGNELQRIQSSFPDFSFHFTDLPELDITSESEVEKALEDIKPDWLINCAGYTAVDKAETDANAAMLINSVAPGILARLCAKHSVRIVHISTDYVFEGYGYRPISESDPKKPNGVYAVSKSEGEDNVLANHPNPIVIRTSWLYSEFGNNFVKTVLRLAREKGSMRMVYDQVGTPTWAGDLAIAIMKLITLNAKEGYYHYSNEGVCSWYDFAVAICKIKGINCPITPILTWEYKTAAPRPCFSVLDKSYFKETTGMTIPHWLDSLKKCLDQLDEQS